MVQKNVSKDQALKQLKLSASRRGLSIQYKESEGREMPIRILNSSKQVVAVGSLKMRGQFIDGQDLARTRREVSSLNSNRLNSSQGGNIKTVINEALANKVEIPEGCRWSRPTAVRDGATSIALMRDNQWVFKSTLYPEESTVHIYTEVSSKFGGGRGSDRSTDVDMNPSSIAIELQTLVDDFAGGLNASRDIDEPDADWDSMPTGDFPEDELDWSVTGKAFTANMFDIMYEDGTAIIGVEVSPSEVPNPGEACDMIQAEGFDCSYNGNGVFEIYYPVEKDEMDNHWRLEIKDRTESVVESVLNR